MAATFTHKTAQQIWDAIAASGTNGVDIEQLAHLTNFNTNTLRTYGRWLEEVGSVEIQKTKSDESSRLKNLYLAREPPPTALKSDSDRLQEIASIVEPLCQSAGSNTKNVLLHAVQQIFHITQQKHSGQL